MEREDIRHRSEMTSVVVAARALSRIGFLYIIVIIPKYFRRAAERGGRATGVATEQTTVGTTVSCKVFRCIVYDCSSTLVRLFE